MEAIQNYSNQYGQNLWQRFRRQEATSEEEATLFRKLFHVFDSREQNSPPSDLHEILEKSGIDSLLMSFFEPGSNADIFINCHNSFMNGFPHIHDYFEIVYVCKGKATDWIDGIELKLQQGDICIHNPNAKNMITEMNDEEDLIINVILPPKIFQRSFYSTLRQNKQLDDFFNRYSLTGNKTDNYMYFPDNSTRVDTIMELLIEEFLRGENSSRFIMESTLVVLFGELIRNYEPDPFLKDLVELIQQNIADISVSQAAQHFGYHRNYFSNLVRKKTGYAFIELLSQLRMQRAASLLLYTQDNIETISTGLGYKSTASFFKHFEEAYGETPSNYRKRNKE